VKIAVISDAHLFQTFTDNYDSVKDFERAIREIESKVSPDMLFLAGDMFDYKKTFGGVSWIITPLRFTWLLGRRRAISMNSH
jgi:predicted MPP superfamily phosphohydrolase